MARTLAVWCPDWPVTAAGAPSTRPVAVLHAGRVLACSAAARAEGVRPLLRRREAQGCCPALELVAHDPTRDARAFEPVLAAVESLTPRIEVGRPGECAFPSRGAARYHGGERALAAEVAAAVDRVLGDLGRCGVGIADGRFAAGLAARRRAIVPPGATPEFLAPFPVGILDRPELTDLLVRLGLSTLGAVAALPRTVLAARFGPEGVRAHRLASGLDEHPRASRRPPPDLRAAAELDPPAERADVAAFAAKALADELVERLDRLGLACSRLRVVAETEHGETLARVWRNEVPVRPASRRGATRGATDPRALQVGAIAERVRWQLDGWLAGAAAARPSGAITRLLLVPDEVVPARGRQLGFWGEETEAGTRATRALSRIRGLLGPEAVRAPSPRGGRGCVASPPLQPAPWPGRVPHPAPTIVHTEPVIVEVQDEQGTPVTVGERGQRNTEPGRLRVADGPWVPITDWTGPWPVDERWWDPGAHQRLARLQVTTAAGTAYLLRLAGDHWRVEATYD